MGAGTFWIPLDRAGHRALVSGDTLAPGCCQLPPFPAAESLCYMLCAISSSFEHLEGAVTSR